MWLLVGALCLPPVRRPAPSLLVDRASSWSNPQGSSLTQVAPSLYLAERPFFPSLPGLSSTDVGCKMAVVVLPGGKLWVHAPVALDAKLRSALSQLGEVAHIVTPNTEHMKWAGEWIRAFPNATSYACPGLRERKPEVGWERSLEELCDRGLSSSSPPAEWGGEIELCWLKDVIPLTSRPFFNEVVFCHKPSRTLIVTDLWWNYPSDPSVPFSSRLWKKAMDFIYRPVYNRLMHGPQWHESYETIMGWDFEYIAPCHGEPVATGGKQVLANHLAQSA